MFRCFDVSCFVKPRFDNCKSQYPILYITKVIYNIGYWGRFRPLTKQETSKHRNKLKNLKHSDYKQLKSKIGCRGTAQQHPKFAHFSFSHFAVFGKNWEKHKFPKTLQDKLRCFSNIANFIDNHPTLHIVKNPDNWRFCNCAFTRFYSKPSNMYSQIAHAEQVARKEWYHSRGEWGESRDPSSGGSNYGFRIAHWKR